MTTVEVVFRADASRQLGSGHVMRCLTLASVLRDQGATVSFVCRETEGHLCDAIEDRDFRVHRFPATESATPPRDIRTPQAWLGDWQEDAAHTSAAIGATGRPAEWLVVDQYALDERYEREMRRAVRRILVIDDLADRVHDCDVLLDQNLVADSQLRYTGKVPETASLLLGPDYALLQPAYVDLHARAAPRTGSIRRILIYFGGSDTANLTRRAVSAFLRLGRTDIDVDVIFTAGSSDAEQLRRQLAGHAHIHWHSNLPSLAPLLARTDLAIGAGGATSWDRLCLGVSSLVVTVAENQRPIARQLDELGLIRWLGDEQDVDEETIERALRAAIERGVDEDESRRALAVVDGNGSRRVCAAMMVTRTTAIVARAATAKDESRLLEWANDPVTRLNAFSSEPIVPASHRVWLRKRLGDRECRFYILETADGVALGQVRLDHNDGEWEIDYAVAPVFRGRGLGRRLLDTALSALRADVPDAVVRGTVKASNTPSHSVFVSLGFDVVSPASTGAVVYRRIV